MADQTQLTVTSAIAIEGKSTIVRNLGTARRESGLSALLVDADMRRPRRASQFGLPPEPGLTNVPTGRLGVNEALVTASVSARGLASSAEMTDHPVSDKETVSILAACSQPGNPQTVLASDRTPSKPGSEGQGYGYEAGYHSDEPVSNGRAAAPAATSSRA